MRIRYQKKKAFAINFLFLLFTVSLMAQIGINNTDPKTALDVNGAFSMRQGGGVNRMNSPETDFFNPYPNPGDIAYSLYVVEYRDAADAWQNFSLSGIKPVAGADGQFLVLVNFSSKKMTLKHNDCTTPENGFWIQGEKDLNLSGVYSNVFLLYSKNIEGGRWVVINKNNHIEVWETPVYDLPTGTITITYNLPQASPESAASINFKGNISPANAANLYLEYVETQENQVVFRVKNTGPPLTGIKFNVMINKI